ncbi:manganese efflux pump MntP family protein [bacterium]|nr:manganese efflux pump MntP family protein [bacterium]
MDILNILGIAIALAMDAFAVAIAVGISLRNVSIRQMFRLSWHFGLFQAGMTALGWGLGTTVRSFIEIYAPWIAFGLLFLIGANMFRGAFEKGDNQEAQKDNTKGLTMIMLSIATSIDALAVGFSLSLLNMRVITPPLVIGLVALIFTIIGLLIGQKVSTSNKLSSFADIIGGVVLWGIGINVLYTHF